MAFLCVYYSMCIAPLLLLGYLLTMQTPAHHTPILNGTILEAQTCESGLGAHARATSSGLFGLGVQYGLTAHHGDWSLTAQPRVGLSYSAEPINALPLQKQFELGVQVLVGYQHLRLSLDYWHLSNAGLKQPNIGIDLLALMGGWTF